MDVARNVMRVRGTESPTSGLGGRRPRGSIAIWLLAGVTAVVVLFALFSISPWRSRPQAPSAAPERMETSPAPPPEAAEGLPPAEAPPAEPGATPDEVPGAKEIAVWETREGTIHLGDDPPPESHSLGKLTAKDAHVLGAVRSKGRGTRKGPDLSELTRRIREDTVRRPISDSSGDPTWSARDIHGIVVSGDALDVSTDWITNPTMIRVARKLCRYVSGQGDTYDAATVVVRGRQGRILARCKAWG